MTKKIFPPLLRSGSLNSRQIRNTIVQINLPVTNEVFEQFTKVTELVQNGSFNCIYENKNNNLQLPWKELYLQFVVILELLLTISRDNSVLPPLLEDFRDPSYQGTTNLIPTERNNSPSTLSVFATIEDTFIYLFYTDLFL